MTTPAVALVSGAASGMGRIAARRLAAAGAEVAAVDLDPEGLAVTAHRSPTMRTFTCDVTDFGAVSDVVSRVETEIGPIERLVHAAGLCRIGTALDHPAASLRHVFEVNYLGTVHMCQAILPSMLRTGSGTVVLFGSLSGWLPSPKLAAYSASKAALTAYAEILAQETANSGVRILCACPGQVETPLADGVRTIDPNVLGGRKGMQPGRVLDSVDNALAQPNPPLFLFPGTSKPVWLARRFAPGLLRSLITRHVRVS